MEPGPDVLVVGAGPTGLTLGLQAHDHGARVRIVDRRPDDYRPSRALLMHPRTLEVLRPLGVTDELMSLAVPASTAFLHLGSRTVPVRLGELAVSGTAFPPLILLRQLDVERALARALGERGVSVERATELIGLAAARDARAQVALRSPAGLERLIVSMVAGCDGMHSTVRRLTGIGWRGGRYRREVLLADVELEGALAAGAAHVAVARKGLVFVFPLGEGASWRLLATRGVAGEPLPPGELGPPVPASELQGLLDEASLDARISGLAWSSRVQLQHRVATQYRRGAVFLAGDAAHASSPAGGQGMNTGIQDAINLGWKLALAGHSNDSDRLLDSYQAERRPVAQQTLAMTHLIFWAESATDPLAMLLRGTVAPLGAPLIPALLRARALTEPGLRLIAGMRVDYRRSPLSTQGRSVRPGGLRSGDRLPDSPASWDGVTGRRHDLLAGPGVHVLLDRDTPAPDIDFGPLTTVHRLADSPGTGVVAVRPDGHVGFLSGDADYEGLRRWLALAGSVRTLSQPSP